MAISADNRYLYAVNTPDNRLEILRITDLGLLPIGSVPVGIEPVAVATRANGEVWVVNHLSDSVSVVSLKAGVHRVIKTINVGDEPRDIVFAGPNRNRAFITTAHRGQNSPSIFTPFVTTGRADVWVIDANKTGNADSGVIEVLTLFGDTPRALAASPDGNTVYAAIFKSGNQTTVLSGDTVNGDLPPPLANIEGEPAPSRGLIVKYDGTDWKDGAGRSWTDYVRLALPDYDVFTIDAGAAVPAETGQISGVGTTLFNMAVNPKSGKLYVSNLEARNNIRFEGPGILGGSTVRGHIAESRITVIDGATVNPRHLNKHIDYSTDLGTPDENAKSLAFPLQMVVSDDGSTLYVAAFGSSKIGVFNTGELENDTFTPDEANHIALSGGGPTGMVLDNARNKLYVLTRFDNSISVVNLNNNSEVRHISLFNPEPASVVAGRPFLYDARHTSSRGDSACASCHIFGDTDHLSWDLGNPDDIVLSNPNPFVPGQFEPGQDTRFHPMKGPMFTNSLRGMANTGPLHWRGDRTDRSVGGDPLDTNFAFREFNVAFAGLVGREGPLPDAEMQAFADFALQITYPPNPIRALDNSLDSKQAEALDFLKTQIHTTNNTCDNCHTFNPEAGHFGTSGLSVMLTLPGNDARLPLKVPHFRNLYTKVGMFERSARIADPSAEKKDEIRGFGFRSDGSSGKLTQFLSAPIFTFPGGNQQRRSMVRFLMAVDSDLAPIVGQQVTLGGNNRIASLQRLGLLVQRAAVDTPRQECDLIAKATVAGNNRGWVRLDSGLFQGDRVSEPPIELKKLINLSKLASSAVTFTCTPPGSGVRMGIDRDEDGFLDRDELDAGSNPADASSVPA
jgi:YVTN family beta-propeller protein